MNNIAFSNLKNLLIAYTWESANNYLTVRGKAYKVTAINSKSNSFNYVKLDVNRSYILTAVKIISYASLIFPAVAFMASLACRKMLQDNRDMPKNIQLNTKHHEKEDYLNGVMENKRTMPSVYTARKVEKYENCLKRTAVSLICYFNASYVGKTLTSAYKATYNLIAAQYPQSEEHLFFWETINLLEDEVIILDLTSPKDEMNIINHKYYPENTSNNKDYNNGRIVVSLFKECKQRNWTTYQYEVQKKCLPAEKKLVSRIHYPHWPDHGITSNKELYHLTKHLQKELESKPNLTLITHCFVGHGRTMTLKAALILQELVKNKKATKENIEDVIVEVITVLREDRSEFAFDEIQLNFLINYGKFLTNELEIKKVEIELEMDNKLPDFDSDQLNELNDYITQQLSSIQKIITTEEYNNLFGYFKKYALNLLERKVINELINISVINSNNLNEQIKGIILSFRESEEEVSETYFISHQKYASDLLIEQEETAISQLREIEKKVDLTNQNLDQICLDIVANIRKEIKENNELLIKLKEEALSLIEKKQDNISSQTNDLVQNLIKILNLSLKDSSQKSLKKMRGFLNQVAVELGKGYIQDLLDQDLSLEELEEIVKKTKEEVTVDGEADPQSTEVAGDEEIAPQPVEEGEEEGEEEFKLSPTEAKMIEATFNQTAPFLIPNPKKENNLETKEKNLTKKLKELLNELNP